MDSVVRIAFFIVLSFALHILSLPFDLIMSAGLPKTGQVGVSYVSRSLESFRPAAETEKITNRVAKSVVQSVQKTSLTEIEQPEQQPVEKTRTEDTVAKAEPKPKKIVEEPMVAAVADISPVKPLKNDTVAGRLSDFTDRNEKLTDRRQISDRLRADSHSSMLKRIKNIDRSDDSTVDSSKVRQPPDVDTKSQPSGEKVAMQETVEPVFEVADHPLLQDALSAPSQPNNDIVSPEAVVAKNEQLSADQGGGTSLQGQGEKVSDQGFESALPRYDVNPPPRYPQVAKLRGWEGKVIFEALILKNGRVGNLNILESSGYRSLDNAARKAIGRWKFRPATSFGVSLDSQVEIPVTFSLKE